jgi:Protein of unknown function (DUF3551)
MYMTLPKRQRTLLLVGAALIAGLGSMATPAAAAPSYPWCARFATTAGECSFNTREQCMETLSGIGGSCTLNPAYKGPAESSGPGGDYNYSTHRRRHS